ncbi:MAG: MBL fold metallo-hydrolase [Candidatus Marsarchaeota archaeon]|nr:MBL fold metallo-hydrolase [Candidatus Marsarchaeota archaeon]
MPIASTCTAILVEDGETNLLLDTAGGHDLLVKMNEAKVNPHTIKNIFITQYDSDHILGIVPLIRAFRGEINPIKRRIFCAQNVKDAIESLFTYVAKIHYEKVKPYLEYVIVNDGMSYELGRWRLKFFDSKSNRTPVMGCTITFPDDIKLGYLGDEPLKEHYIAAVKNCDVLVHDAFCLEADKKEFEPHEKNHSTVKDAATNAMKVGAKKLVLFHMEDKTLKTRKQAYLKEAKQYFSGDVFVPVDLDSYVF